MKLALWPFMVIRIYIWDSHVSIIGIAQVVSPCCFVHGGYSFSHTLALYCRQTTPTSKRVWCQITTDKRSTRLPAKSLFICRSHHV